MKKFIIDGFKELKVLFILEILLILSITMLIRVNKFDINYWNWKAFVMSFSIWVLSSIIDKKSFNLGTLLGTVSFMYLIWWFVFNLKIT
jgi:hypothetical protein